MKISCNVLYNGNLTDLTEKVLVFLKKDSSNVQLFINKFKQGEGLSKIRYEKTPTDSQESVDDSSKAFIRDMNTVILAITKMMLSKPKMAGKQPKLLNLITELENTFNIELDKTQFGSLTANTEEQNLELKTTKEIQDSNTTNLLEHLKEIYGTGAYDIIRTLKEDFDDLTTAQAYWDINTGTVSLKSNTLLNEKFQNLKNKYFNTIVLYMLSIDNVHYKDTPISMVTDLGEFIGSKYFNLMDSFYKHIKELKDDFRNTIVREQSDRINQKELKNKTGLYQQLIQTLLQNDDFKELVLKNKNLKYNRKLEFENNLYEADHYSFYYDLAKKFIAKLNLADTKIAIGENSKTIQEILNEIESPSKISLLKAVNAYTCLTHFDELLLEMHGNSFEITPSLKGLEMANMQKYTYHLDTAHEKKGWLQSEAIDSEKYIANMTRRVLNQIRVYDYKINAYLNRRVDSTSFIVAARNLINDIIYNNVIWDSTTSTSVRRRKKLNQFILDTLMIHSNPEERFQLVLESLFGHPENDNSEPLVNSIESKKLLTDYDLNLLYSVYKAVYDKSNPNSLISQELKNLKAGNGTVLNLVLEISGYVDRNTTMDYLETSYDFETGQVITKVKKKYFNNKLLYKTRVEINYHVNNVTAERAKTLQDKYNFNVIPTASKYVYYLLTLGGKEIALKVPEDLGGKILNNSDKITFTDTDIFKNIDNIDLVNFREKILNGSSLLTDDEKILQDMLKFIDDLLGLKILTNPAFGLQVLQSYKIIYNPVTDKAVGKYYMMPLMLLAIRAAYANSRYAEANGKSLKEYLESLTSDDGIYSSYVKNIKTSRLFSSKFNNVRYTIASSKDKVLDMWTDAQSMLIGDASKATTKDKLGNSIPNNSVNKLGSIINHYLLKQMDTNTGSLMFVKDYTLIKGTYHDLETTSWNNDSKAIKAFSGSELFFHSIFNKFWGNYLNNGTVVVLPTTYSDKTTFINYAINTKFLNKGEDILQSKAYESEIIDLYLNTIGQMYKTVWNDTVNKLTTIANAYNSTNNTNLSYREVLQNLTESELISLANSLGIDLELDKDYRLIKKNGKKVAAVNEELEYYATNLYANKDTLAKALNSEKINFVQNILDANSSFLVIDYDDDISYYVGKKISQESNSKNAILRIIQQVYKNDPDARIDFFNNWIDAKTGKLIIAKQGDKNIVGIGDEFSNTQNVTLNPLLDKFFYVEGLLSNNLRMSLTGSEINHPNKAFNTLFKLLREVSKDEIVKTYLDSTNNEVIEEDLYLAVSIIKNLNYEGDLHLEYINSLNVSQNVKNILTEIYNKSLLTISNISQGTLFKRNVIIPATLQYCQQGVKDGIANKIKCAVIRDELANVWNYRGDHEGAIDASDGAAWIDPFLSILENKSLGSLAVGFIKKPIWHSYDVNSGTAFLAKFATDTITNEVMRASLNSHTSMYKLFKKMTNLLWKGDVNLTESLMLGDLSDSASMFKWFLTTILGNTVLTNSKNNDEYIFDNHLMYLDAYGTNKEIKGFNKTKLADGRVLYYTEELVIVGDISKNIQKRSTLEDTKTLKVNKVYHIFTKDKHLTFDTYEKAKVFLDENPEAHTINSLFELHTALGGLNCIDSKGNNSEFNNEVIVNFMNNVGHIKSGRSKTLDLVNLDNYEQPLKNYHIGYALNNTAVKNGAKNVNQKEAWFDDSELTYFEVDSDGLGMQMNADHDIINSELTEFSQVITATSAYGYTHDLCNEIFQGLASAALQASKKSLDAVDNFLKANFEGKDLAVAYSDLYDAIGRIILTNQSIKDKESLLNIIMEAVTKVFYKSKNHNNDSAKIPFSDANIYSDFIATLASTINKESIKRKHPGSGNVMAPGFNVIQYFEIDGQKVFASDVLKLARLDFRVELTDYIKNSVKDTFNAITNTVKVNNLTYNIGKMTTIPELLQIAKLINPEYVSLYEIDNQDNAIIAKHLINTYLEKKLVEAPVYEDQSWFMPSDNVDIINEEGDLLRTVELDSLDIYYKLKDGLIDSEIEHDVIITPDYSKDKYKIALKEAPDQMFILERLENSNEYNIRFKTGGFDSLLQRRTLSSLSPELKNRLFNAALEILPEHSIISLSPTTAEQIKTKKGGLTKGSINGYNSIFTDVDRHTNVEIVKTSDEYTTLYFDKNGLLHTAVIAKYEKTKNIKFNHKYRNNITRAHNLRPSLIRWLYYPKDDNGNSLSPRYMNIFDMEAVKKSYQKPNKTPEEIKQSREEILNILHDLHNGFFTLGDFKYNIIEGTLENTAAELVMSNMHKEKFNIGNESLNEILLLGEDYFYKKNKKLNKPHNTNYDIAFLKDTGQNTLITFNKVVSNGYIQETPFDASQLATNEKDEILLMKGNRELFEVGKWVNIENALFKNGKFYIDGKLAINLELYRLKNTEDPKSVQKQLIYLKKYLLIDTFTDKGNQYYKTNILYAISDLEVFKEAFKSENLPEKTLIASAEKQRSSIVRKIYESDKYKLATILSGVPYSKQKFNIIKSALSNILSNYYISQPVKNLLQAEIDSLEIIDSFDKEASSKYIYLFKTKNPEKFLELLTKYLKPEEIEEINNSELSESLVKAKISKYLNKNLFGDIIAANKNKFKELEKNFLKEEAHRKWVSFQDSLKFISSRIPAQTLQSFMSMLLVGWTENSKNMAYVSHFLTYLQGSDYDIDKAYIMSQSYDSNAVYIGWSNLFDYTSVKTLEASKKLPVPKKVLISLNENGIDLNSEINELLPLLDNNANITGDENNKIKALELITNILRKLENNTIAEEEINSKNGKKYVQLKSFIKYNNSKNLKAQQLLNVLNRHEFYPISVNIAELAYKNVASANIYAVAHDIRNRDLAYTAISMDILKDAAKNSPKGKSSEKLNMFNPLTKYVMQYQNLVGKNVISIAANGEKVWFNAFYHWHLILKNGTEEDIKRLKFRQTFNRILGRSGTEGIKPRTITHLPDLNYRDLKIKNILMSEFGATNETLEYKYVDLLISLLLSAATDNAKELILDKINAGTQFARMYVYAMMTGFNIDDIVLFMTSPVSQFIDKMAQANIFLNESVNNNATTAINLSQGIIGISKFLHGTISSYELNPITNETEKVTYRKSTYVKDSLLSSVEPEMLEKMHKVVGHSIDEDGKYLDFKGLGEVMQAIINTIVTDPIYKDFDVSAVINSNDTEINTYLAYCQNIIENLKTVCNTYKSYDDYKADVEEFKKLYDLSTEISTISSAYLGLNQGLPTDELSILKRLISMSKLVYAREKALGLVDRDMYEKSKSNNTEEELQDDTWEDIKSNSRKTGEKRLKELENNKTEAIKRLIANNPTIENVELRLDEAHENGLINGFDVVEYLKNNEYRLKVKDYYGLLMGTLNVFDMMESIPHYKLIIECFKTLVVSKNTLSSKSRLIAKLALDSMSSSVSDLLLKGIIDLTDKLNVKQFAETCPILSLEKPIEGFNAYFEDIKTLKIDFSTLEGLATFKHWMEHEFRNWAEEQKDTKYIDNSINPLYNNGVFKHLTIVPDNDRPLLSLDIDLLNPDVTSVSRENYDEILRGMSDLEKIKFKNSDYTIADLFQMYNLIVNNNKYGSERFTTTFKVCTSPNNIENKYLNFIANQDSQFDHVQDYDYVDYQISAAPIVNTYQEKFRTELFIKVNDPIQGYILKHRTKNNTYDNYSLIPPSIDEESETQKLKRLENFSLYSPFEMPHTYNELFLIRTIDYDLDISKMSEEEINKLRNEIENIIKKYSVSSKLFIIKDC